MIRSTLLRQFVSSIAIFMLVWCQTSAIAQAGPIVMIVSEAEIAATTPCHQTTTESRSDPTQQTGCQARCQSHNAWFETTNIHLPAIDDLPLAVVYFALFDPAATSAAPDDQTTERAASPPLILVYGRLLI